MSTTSCGRVIIHLDLDCFYAQVEQRRLGIAREVPAAVQQWDGLIAINYAARAQGITRHMRVKEAMQKCPELQCIHVQTLGGETGNEGVKGPVNAGLTHPNDRSLQKACLERYRRASAEIVAIIRHILPQAKVEKASIDEVYIDVTSLVEKELAEREDAATSEHASVDAFAWGSMVEGGPLNPENELDRRLSVGASIACRLRGAIREKLDFTSSAGIAQNKLLAKVGSARHKPNQQTIVPSRGIEGLMQDLPLRKLRNFGGKLGTELQALGAMTAGHVAAMPFWQLQQHFGERAQWIANCVRGLHDEPVTERELSKSMLAAKSFEATADVAALERWLGILADELADRMVTDVQLNQRYPRLLVLSYRQKDSPAGRSRSTQMPRAPPPGPTAAMLKEAALSVLQKCPDAIPCCNLGLTATEFQDAPGDEQGCITRFFAPKAQKDKPDKGPAVVPSASASEQRYPEHARPQPASNTIARLFRRAAGHTQQPAPLKTGSSLSEPHSNPGPPDRAAIQEVEASGTSESGQRAALADASGCDALFKDLHEDRLEESEHQPQVQALEQGSARDNTGSQAEAALSDRMQLTVGEGSHKLVRADQPTACTAKPADPGLLTANAPPPRDREDNHGNDTSSNAASSALPSGIACSSFETAGAGDNKPELAGVEGIDLEEQKRILHDIWVRSNLRKPGPMQKRRMRQSEGALKESGTKQPRLTDLFAKKG